MNFQANRQAKTGNSLSDFCRRSFVFASKVVLPSAQYPTPKLEFDALRAPVLGATPAPVLGTNMRQY